MAKSLGVVNGEDAVWKARQDMRTLKEAAEITADKKRHAAAMAHAEDEIEALKAIKPPK